MEGLTVSSVETDDDLLDIIPLKQADDNEALKRMKLDVQTEDEAFTKVIKLKSRGYDFWIAKLNEEPIGYAAGIMENDDIYRSEGIYVKPEHRNKGYGTEIKRSQIAFAKDIGCKKLVSNVSGNNPASLRVQKKCGISATRNEVTGGYHLSLELNGS